MLYWPGGSSTENSPFCVMFSQTRHFSGIDMNIVLVQPTGVPRSLQTYLPCKWTSGPALIVIGPSGVFGPTATSPPRFFSTSRAHKDSDRP